MKDWAGLSPLDGLPTMRIASAFTAANFTSNFWPSWSPSLLEEVVFG